MELAFLNKNLRQVCENEDIAKSNLGGEVAEKLKNRLADLRAVNSVDKLPVGNPKKMGENPPLYRIELINGVFIFITPNHVKPLKLKSGLVDWSRVRRIKIIQIGSDI